MSYQADITKHIEISDKEFEVLRIMSNRNHLWSFCEHGLSCEFLVRYGLATEDSDGRVYITSMGREFLRTAKSV
jgi:hypothetical protein